ncbi:DUF2059 domain-containing protein [Nitrospirillum sp. BR 11163]|uniref:DUF2059 domain-containing protein n=1 Tax=Nitrospirillum sp. BR 11163 TaxID=3104323 RepID=UPI002AFF732D|nr:DUF2059 domain-containing protein [Nitrospirillum sp. BR 11163]MEA1673863.1 DUF2059 domain-containing protein [Nitrospirillum sp. BR 11163]
MRLLKGIAAGLIGAWVMIAVPAFAQNAGTPSPKALELAHRLIEKTHAGDVMQQILPMAIDPLVQKLKIANPGREAEVQGLVDKRLLPDFKKAVAPMTDAIAVTYAELFTETELEQVLAFYDTPAGAKLITQMPLVMQQTMAKSKAMLPQVMGKVISDFITTCKGEGLAIPQG